MNHGMDSDETMEGAEDSPELGFLDAEKKRLRLRMGRIFLHLEWFFQVR